jgi:hypothetical protein
LSFALSKDILRSLRLCIAPWKSHGGRTYAFTSLSLDQPIVSAQRCGGPPFRVLLRNILYINHKHLNKPSHLPGAL